MRNMWMTICLALSVLCFTCVFCGVHPDGISQVSRAQDALGNYEFSYSVSNGEGDQFRREGTDQLGRVVGTYGLTHPDGRQRVVDYVADKEGFRAQVRSNEPGIATSDSEALTVINTNHDSPLAVAASSLGGYGSRIKTQISRVAYVEPEKPAIEDSEKPDEAPRESRESSYDDYRPQNPVAYYPGEHPIALKSLNNAAYEAERVEEHRPNILPQESLEDGRPLDVYLPPIDPNTAVRRPAYYLPNDGDAEGSYQSTTSRRPFIPPYGGFDDDPLPVARRPGFDDGPLPVRRPGVPLPDVHGGVVPDHFRDSSPTPPTALYGAGRYPSAELPVPREFDASVFPPRSNYPPIPRSPGGLPPPNSQTYPPGVSFNPPSYEGGLNPPNFVLRAVPIPNGIQAVRVDPNTGRVYERVVYPLFLRHDGHPDYDRNILLHNDAVSDDDAIRNDNHGHYDIPFRRRPSFREARHQPISEHGDFGGSLRQFNRSNAIDLKSLSVPTAKEFSWLHQQLAAVEGFNRNGYPNENALNNQQVENPRYPEFDNFDDLHRDPYFRSRFPLSGSLDHSGSDTYPRNTRQGESLSPSDSNKSQTVNLQTSSSDHSETGSSASNEKKD